MAKKSRFQINIEYYAFWCVISFFRILPRKLAIYIGALLGDFIYFFIRKLRRPAIINTQIAFPEMSDAERLNLVRGSFRNLGRQFAELSQFPKATEESLKNLVDFPLSDAQWLRYNKEKENKRGIIFLTPHFGGWEVLAFASSALIGPQSYLVRRLDNPRLEEMFEKLRGKFGNKPIDKKKAVLPALKILREGGNIGILPDLNTQQQEGFFVPFFGKMACTTSGVAALAMRTNALVVVFGAIWDYEKKKYVVNIGSILEFEANGDRRKGLEDFTAKFTKEIENLIRKSPEQWFWTHKRWKTRPEGEDSIY